MFGHGAGKRVSIFMLFPVFLFAFTFYFFRTFRLLLKRKASGSQSGQPLSKMRNRRATLYRDRDTTAPYEDMMSGNSSQAVARTVSPAISNVLSDNSSQVTRTNSPINGIPNQLMASPQILHSQFRASPLPQQTPMAQSTSTISLMGTQIAQPLTPSLQSITQQIPAIGTTIAQQSSNDLVQFQSEDGNYYFTDNNGQTFEIASTINPTVDNIVEHEEGFMITQPQQLCVDIEHIKSEIQSLKNCISTLSTQVDNIVAHNASVAIQVYSYNFLLHLSIY